MIKKLLFIVPLALLLMGSTYENGSDFAADSVAVVNSAGTFRATLLQPTVLTASRGIAIQDDAMTITTTAEVAEIAVNTTHTTSDGSDHTFIDQDVTSGSGPSFTNAILTTPALGTPSAVVLTNATGTATNLTAGGVEANAIGLAEMAGGTDGNLITYDASGDPAFVATGTAGQILTSNGAGAAPTMQGGGADYRIIPIHHFVANDDVTGKSMQYNVASGSLRVGDANSEAFAEQDIDPGRTVATVDVWDDNARAVEVWEKNITTGVKVSKGTGNANTTINITDVAESSTTLILIEWIATATDDDLFGARLNYVP